MGAGPGAQENCPGCAGEREGRKHREALPCGKLKGDGLMFIMYFISSA